MHDAARGGERRMLADLLSGLSSGAGFMTGVLIIYTIYDGIFTLIETRRMKKAAAKNKRKRR